MLKKFFRNFKLGSLGVFGIMLCLLALVVLSRHTAMAQDVPAPVIPDWLTWLTSVLQGFIVKYPKLSSILSIVAVMRAIMKPLMSFLNTIVLATPSKSDDAFLDAWQKNKIWAIFLYLLDWLGSIKILP